jgi:hypothetical protein
MASLPPPGAAPDGFVEKAFCQFGSQQVISPLLVDPI